MACRPISPPSLPPSCGLRSHPFYPPASLGPSGNQDQRAPAHRPSSGWSPQCLEQNSGCPEGPLPPAAPPREQRELVIKPVSALLGPVTYSRGDGGTCWNGERGGDRALPPCGPGRRPPVSRRLKALGCRRLEGLRVVMETQVRRRLGDRADLATVQGSAHLLVHHGQGQAATCPVPAPGDWAASPRLA